MTQITLKQLRYFEALAREGHFGRAAEACAITQPALSMQIQELEDVFGIALVERTKSGVKLTAKGQEIAVRARRLLSDVHDLLDVAKRSEGTLNGPLRFGVIPSMAPYLLPPLLPLLKRSHPGLTLHVRETQTHVLVGELLAGKLDAVLLALPVRHADIETVALFEDRFLLASPRDKKSLSRTRVARDQIDTHRLMLLEEGHCLRDQALAYCDLRQSDAINTFGASSLSTIAEMVSAGHGITLLPEMCIGVEARGRNIALQRFATPEPSRIVGLVWRRSSPLAEEYKALGKVIQAAGETLIRNDAESAA